MLILKFNQYQENLSGDTLIRVSGAKIDGNASYAIQIRDVAEEIIDVEEDKKIIIASGSSPKASSTSKINLENISCMIFQDSIFLTTTDKTREGKLEFENFTTPQAEVLKSNVIILNERLDIEVLSFYQIALVNNKNQLTMSVRKMRYSEAELALQTLNMNNLIALLKTTGLYQLIDEQALCQLCKDESDKLKESLLILQNNLEASIVENQGLVLLMGELTTEKETLVDLNNNLSNLLENGFLDATNASIQLLTEENIISKHKLIAAENALKNANALNESLEEANKLLYAQKTQAEKDKNNILIEKIQLEAKYRNCSQDTGKFSYITITCMRFRSQIPNPTVGFDQLVSEKNDLYIKILQSPVSASSIQIRIYTSSSTSTNQTIIYPNEPSLTLMYKSHSNMNSLLEGVATDKSLYHLRFAAPSPSSSLSIDEDFANVSKVGKILLQEIVRRFSAK